MKFNITYRIYRHLMPGSLGEAGSRSRLGSNS